MRLGGKFLKRKDAKTTKDSFIDSICFRIYDYIPFADLAPWRWKFNREDAKFAKGSNIHSIYFKAMVIFSSRALRLGGEDFPQ